MTMRSWLLRSVVALSWLGVIAGIPALTSAADPDWKAVEQALGKSGQLQAGDVFRVGMPRTDLNVTVRGVPVKAGFALGSYAAFKQVGDHAMVMGDLVLLDAEVPAVLSGLLSGGLEGTRHPQPPSPDVPPRHLHALLGPRRGRPAREGPAPGPLREWNAPGRCSGGGRPRRSGARHG